MPSCCKGCCERYEDGILSGHDKLIDPSFRKPLTIIFQDHLKSRSVNGSKPAVEYADNFITYTQLDDFSTSLGKDIRDRIGMDFKIQNPDQDALIATCLPTSERAICIIFAILKTGAAYLPVDPEYPEQLLLDIIKTFQPVLLITDDNGPLFNKYDPSKFTDICKVVTLEELWIDMEIPTTKKQRKNSIDPTLIEYFERHDDPVISPEKLPAVIFHTRGLCGNPIGVRISHLSIVNRALFDWNQLHLKSSDSCSLTLPFSLPDSIAQIFVPLLRGCTLHVFRRQDLRDMSEFVRTVANKSINRLSIPNFHFRDFLAAIDIAGRQETVKSLKTMKHVISRGGFLRPNDVALFFDMFKKVALYNCNGPAETTGEVIYEKFGSLREYQMKRVLGRLTLGRVIDNAKLYIVGDHLGIISDGNQGEICVSGLCLALGYVNGNSDERKKLFVQNPHIEREGHEMIFRSGEFGRIIVGRDGKRRIYVEGRDDKLVKRNGHDFSIDDITKFLKEFPFAKEAYVYIYHKGKPTQEMIGFIIPNEKSSALDMPDIVEIEFALRDKLPEWAMPDEIMIVEVLPKHYYGDFCPFCLMEQFHEQREPKFSGWDILAVPPDKLEIAITLIKGMFKFASIPVETSIPNLNKSYFELGGNSSNAVMLLVFLNKRGYTVSLKDFYTTPKLIDFINLMETKQNQPQASSTQTQAAFTVKPNFHIMLEMKDEFKVDKLKKKHKDAAIELIAAAYCEKGELQAYNMVSSEDFSSFLNSVWSVYEDEGLSIVVTRKSNKAIVGVLLCQDFFVITDTTRANGALFHMLEFFHEIKGNLVQFVPHRTGETLEISWMATHASFRPDQNIKMITMLHTEIIKLAKNAGFTGLFNPTTNKLSRTLCTEVFGYMLLEDFCANKYKELDGSRPFHLAGDLVAAAALLLRLRDPEPPSEASTTVFVNPVDYFEKREKKGIIMPTTFASSSNTAIVNKK